MSENVSKNFRKSENVSKNFRMSENVSKKFRKSENVSNFFGKSGNVSKHFRKSICLSSSSSCWRARAGTQREYGKVSCRRRPRVEAAVPRKPAGKGGGVCGMCQVQS